MARTTISTFTAEDTTEVVDFYVEAYLNTRWKEVAGPYTTRQAAEKKAKDYSIEHGVKTRVVAEM